MKKIIIVCCCFFTLISNAQANKTARKSTPIYSDKNVAGLFEDSASNYYVRGWNAYRINDFGAARYFWERGANCITNVPSRYSCAFRLGLMHQNGEGIGVNYDIAFYYYNLAYANGQRVGNVEATKNVASYYENGMSSIPSNYKKALEWYQKAKQQGNANCNEDIARIKQKLAQNLTYFFKKEY